MSADSELAAYWQESSGWEADRVRQWRDAARIWRWVGAGSLVCCVFASMALIALMPLKRVEPYVIRVDNSTGIVDVVPGYTGTAEIAQVVTRYLLSHYVTTCERFNFETAESDYAECGAFHTPQRNALWYAQWRRSNPASPLNVYRDGTTVRAEVTSVTFLRSAAQGGLAQIRFVRRLRPSPDAAEQVSHWIVAVQYRYQAPTSDPKQRSYNPLGFKVEEYHAEQEALEEGQHATGAAAAASSGPAGLASSGQPAALDAGAHP